MKVMLVTLSDAAHAALLGAATAERTPPRLMAARLLESALVAPKSSEVKSARNPVQAAKLSTKS